MLEPNRFMIKEQVKFLQSYCTYDIYDEKGHLIGVAQEKLSPLTQFLRWFVHKNLMATRVEVREKPDDALVFTISRRMFLLQSRVEVHDSLGELIGYFKSRFFSFSGGFHVYDRHDRHFAEVNGNLIGFHYRVISTEGDLEFGQVTKQWTGLSLELFTTADTYAVEISEELSEQPVAKMLVLAAALATDMIFKSGSR
ncbi:MAG: hypothetical protein LC104_18260 [Bacteroidales bacterium]|nr:hypothetical protein [Bacteroidales bacterium]